MFRICIKIIQKNPWVCDTPHSSLPAGAPSNTARECTRIFSPQNLSKSALNCYGWPPQHRLGPSFKVQIAECTCFYLLHFVAVCRVDVHGHAPDERAARWGIVLKKIHQLITDNPTVPVRRAFDRATVDQSGDSDEAPDYGSVRTRAKRLRARFVPPIPADIEDVEIAGEWRRTWKNKPFLLHEDPDWGVAVFTTRKMLKALQESQCLYVDGTFRTAPYPYYQFLTIHGMLHGFVIPLVFCLLTHKTTGHYRQVLQHLKQAVRHLLHRRLQPTRMIMDFEQGLMTAVETELPNCRPAGCYFHFTQSLWRKLQEFGLSSPYRHHRRLKRTVRLVMSIGFLPVLLVRQNFVMLSGSRRTRRLTRRFPDITEWLQYVEDTYMSVNAPFPPPVWNIYGRDMTSRTNNHVEGLCRPM